MIISLAQGSFVQFQVPHQDLTTYKAPLWKFFILLKITYMFSAFYPQFLKGLILFISLKHQIGVYQHFLRNSFFYRLISGNSCKKLNIISENPVGVCWLISLYIHYLTLLCFLCRVSQIRFLVLWKEKIQDEHKICSLEINGHDFEVGFGNFTLLL